MVNKNRIGQIIIYLLFAIIFSFLCMSEYYVAMSRFVHSDEKEHLKSAFLIYQGLVPYRDFFQNHNPLIWYITALGYNIFSLDANVLYIVRILSVITYMITGLYIFLLGMYVSSSKSEYRKYIAMLGAIIFMSVPRVASNFIDFRPDNFMILFLLIGLEQLFSYLENKKDISLYISFLSFLLSFLFLQKILLVLVYIGVYIFYLVYLKKIDFSVFLKASLLVVGLYVSYLGYLYYEGGLKRYWELCFLLNTKLKFKGYQMMGYYEEALLIMIALLCCWNVATSKNDKLKIISGCYLVYGLQYIIYYVPWSQYVQLFYVFIGCIIPSYLSFVKNKKILSLFILSGILYSGNLFLVSKKIDITESQLKQEFLKEKEILELSNITDFVEESIFRYSALEYYPFIGIYGLMKLDYKYFRKSKTLGINEQIKAKRPKIITWVVDWTTCMKRGSDICYAGNFNYVEQLDGQWVFENYINNGRFWIRKD